MLKLNLDGTLANDGRCCSFEAVLFLFGLLLFLFEDTAVPFWTVAVPFCGLPILARIN